MALAGPFDDIIVGAKKENTGSVRLRTGFTPKSMVRLQNEIQEKFGVSLRIDEGPKTLMLILESGGNR